MDFVIDLLQSGASDVIIRDENKLWYLSSKELLNQNNKILINSTVFKILLTIIMLSLPNFILNIFLFLLVQMLLQKGIDIVFKDWNERIVVNNSVKMAKMEKFIKDMGQRSYEMSQESIGYLKSLF